MSKNIWMAVAAVVLVVGVVAAVWYFKQQTATTTADTASSSAAPTPTMTTTPTSDANQGGAMQSEDIKVGTGAEAVAGKNVTVNYVGTLTDGTKFDASADHGQPFSFELGAGRVIEGWDKGVVGMKVGGTRKLTIPPEMGYGDQAVPGIPANSTLVFEIELLKVE